MRASTRASVRARVFKSELRLCFKRKKSWNRNLIGNLFCYLWVVVLRNYHAVSTDSLFLGCSLRFGQFQLGVDIDMAFSASTCGKPLGPLHRLWTPNARVSAAKWSTLLSWQSHAGGTCSMSYIGVSWLLDWFWMPTSDSSVFVCMQAILEGSYNLGSGQVEGAEKKRVATGDFTWGLFYH